MQLVTCVVFDNQTLEILRTAGTHNDADAIANSLYVDNKIDALTDVVKFFSEELNAINIVGMHLNQFQSFVEMHPDHPLCQSM